MARSLSAPVVACVLDCGQAVNPDIVRSQMEGAVIYGLTAALYGGLNLEDGAIRESNFHDYPMLRMDESPEIDVVIIDSGTKPTGVGEPGLPRSRLRSPMRFTCHGAASALTAAAAGLKATIKIWGSECQPSLFFLFKFLISPESAPSQTVPLCALSGWLSLPRRQGTPQRLRDLLSV